VPSPPPAACVVVLLDRPGATPNLIGAVRRRAAAGGKASFHVVVPKGEHHYRHLASDPEEASRRVLEDTRAKIRHVADGEVTGEVGDPVPLTALQDAVNRLRASELIISTVPSRASRLLRVDLVHKARALGLPVTHVESHGTKS
jgi:hypothetical protein